MNESLKKIFASISNFFTGQGLTVEQNGKVIETAQVFDALANSKEGKNLSDLIEPTTNSQNEPSKEANAPDQNQNDKENNSQPEANAAQTPTIEMTIEEVQKMITAQIAPLNAQIDELKKSELDKTAQIQTLATRAETAEKEAAAFKNKKEQAELDASIDAKNRAKPVGADKNFDNAPASKATTVQVPLAKGADVFVTVDIQAAIDMIKN